MILLPVLLAIFLRRRFQIPWLLFCVGALTFIISQVVHFPLNEWLSDVGLLPKTGTLEQFPLWQTALILGLTAGICEELARTVGYAILKRFRRFEESLMLGLGHGGIESMVFGGVMTAATFSSLFALQGVDLDTLNLGLEKATLLSNQMEIFSRAPLTAFFPFEERFLAIGAHMIFSLLVLQAFTRRNWLYIPVAILYHAVIDAVLVYAAVKLNNPVMLHAIFLVMLIPGLIWLWSLRPRGEQRRSHRAGKIGAELHIFWIILRKELLQQWRSKRILVVVGVFALFGMVSPLIAKFTPEILKSVEGAEQFADLIPEPTVVDAITQYIKNLTQFGFILAILLGMGSVVGEKEKGIAGLILSKPLPRWAYISGKLAAQIIVYCLAFIISTIGAYYYTVVIFEKIRLSNFLMINSLMLLWLLTFVGVTLLGSVLGKSTGASAGIGLGLSVLLLLASYLPRVGMLAPGGLVAWASQLGMVDTNEVVALNGGAVAMSLVIVLMSLLISIAIFERQEL
jgi:ABC-2 type transport system permease protein